MSQQEMDDWLALTLVPGLGPKLTDALITRFGSASAVRGLSASDFQEVPQIGSRLGDRFAAALAKADVARERELLDRHGVRIVLRGSADYPARLATLPDAPHVLFVRGETAPADDRAVAIVGSRGMTGYGRRVTEILARGLVQAGLTIVSGLARGIDGVAHRAAVDAGGRTIAVLAGGLARIYPPEHADLADLVAGHGALITETPMQMAPQPGMFPARNRLISGLSLGVIIVEANERSGALITARHAAEQNREVFAVPGPIDSAASAGCLALIRTGAKLVRNVDDVLEDIHGIRAVARNSGSKAVPPMEPPPDLPAPEAAVIRALTDGPAFVDQLATSLSLSLPDLMQLLMRMELQRLVRRLPGSRYERA
jgi:DNA processing protein